MVETKKVVKWYFILAIIYSIILMILFFKPVFTTIPIRILFELFRYINLIWFFVNIAILIFFIVKKIEKIAWLIPGLFILERVFLLVVRMTGANRILINLTLIFPITILIISIKLIRLLLKK